MRLDFRAFVILAAIGAGAAVAASGAAGKPNRPVPATGARAVAISVTPVVPTDISATAAPAAALSDAAVFAWQEFFALNWTAQVQDAHGQSQRDTPDTSCPFGKLACAAGRPVVWQTYRGKVEIFPGDGNPPSSFVTPGPTSPPTFSYGYDAAPNYVYASPVSPCVASPSPASSAQPWVNLDEKDQIALDQMYAGAGPPNPSKTPPPGTANSQPQLIRFVAKANRTMYSYIEGNGLYPGGGVNSNSGNGQAAPVAGASDPPAAVPPYGGTPPPYVSFPNGTIETKSGWRPLTGAELSSGKFVTRKVRYYESTPNGNACWREDTFGLVALHIIQKTPSAPYFIYATFEQADNILTSDGKPVETVDGDLQPYAAYVLRDSPTTPRTALNDLKTSPPPTLPPQIVAKGPPCSPIGKRLYYRNSADLPGLPPGAICVNYRDNAIPLAIVAANARAHDALAKFESANGGYHSPYEHYKLINVQYVPMNKAAIGPYVPSPGPSAATESAVFSMANIVVETNHTLQLFSGGLVAATGSNTDNPAFKTVPVKNAQTFKNVYFNKMTFDMGGCMGCHGAAAQQQGSDFSVITFQGPVGIPEFPAPVTARGTAARVPTNRTYLLKLGGPPMIISH